MAHSLAVLVVEDQELILSVLENGLSNEGYTVTGVASGEAAIAELNKHDVRFTLLLTDINLSGPLSGWDVARHARSINEALPVIYMTGASSGDWLKKGVTKSHLMQKPFTMAHAVKLVRAALNGCTYV